MGGEVKAAKTPAGNPTVAVCEDLADLLGSTRADSVPVGIHATSLEEIGKVKIIFPLSWAMIRPGGK